MAAIRLLLGTAASVMSLSAQLDAINGKPLDFQYLWRDFKKYWLRILGFYALVSVLLMLFAWLFFFGLILFIAGAVLMIIIGAIVISRYLLTPYVIIDQDVGISEAYRSALHSAPRTPARFGE